MIGENMCLDERGRLTIPQKIRETMELKHNSVCRIEQHGENKLLITVLVK